MVPSTYKPDWLLETPSRNPFLVKKEYMHLPNSLDKLMNKIYTIAYDKESIDYIQYTKKFLEQKKITDVKLLK
jgi:hypothetical protein